MGNQDVHEPDPDRRRPPTIRTGSEQPIDPEDLVRVSGRDPTPERIEWARRRLQEEGAAAIERYLP
ncbi:hypothetical protein [Streptomyces sp. XD-27]|uniref:hypothetical protein n=1 Tax=Streptomyces sp. XD-27 TaxID=3062779 RepID=UPI0026F42D7D|nr:hypothetical protein [Streptomyces sp. XD-27]WKX73816.1 hypothetical protein Q3Y56_31615 [Streptomyces sp. XD-27]